MQDPTLDNSSISWQDIGTVKYDSAKRILLAVFNEEGYLHNIDIGCWELIEYSDSDGRAIYDWQTINGYDLTWTHWAKYD